jgi:hypothetical protein
MMREDAVVEAAADAGQIVSALNDSCAADLLAADSPP